MKLLTSEKRLKYPCVGVMIYLSGHAQLQVVHIRITLVVSTLYEPLKCGTLLSRIPNTLVHISSILLLYTLQHPFVLKL